MSHLLISIIIPTLNEEKNLNKLLPYLRSHAIAETEIIVVDSCQSTDDIDDICKVNDVVKMVCTESSRAAQMNLGAASASGDILYFLHADATPPNTYIHDIGKAIDEGFDFAIFSYRFASDSLLLAINSKFTKRKGLFAGGGDQSICMLKSTFDSIGGYDENFSIMEDFKLFHTAKRKGLKYKVIPNDMIVSARKYDENSYLRVNLSNLIAFSMYHTGADPNQIKTIYRKLLR